jgi:hypothetical protein
MANKQKAGTRLFVTTLLILLLCSPLVSMAIAADDVSGQVPPEEDSTETSDGPTLYASEEEDNPLLIEGNDEVTAPTENDSAGAAENTEGDPTLIAPRSILNNAANNTAAIIGISVLVAGMALIAAVAVITTRKKQSA